MRAIKIKHRFAVVFYCSVGDFTRAVVRRAAADIVTVEKPSSDLVSHKKHGGRVVVIHRFKRIEIRLVIPVEAEVGILSPRAALNAYAYHIVYFVLNLVGVKVDAEPLAKLENRENLRRLGYYSFVYFVNEVVLLLSRPNACVTSVNLRFVGQKKRTVKLVFHIVAPPVSRKRKDDPCFLRGAFYGLVFFSLTARKRTQGYAKKE